MNYEKKLKIRLSVYICCTIIGILMMFLGYSGLGKGDFISSLGLAYTVIGIVRIIKLTNLLRNPAAFERTKTAETDERNIMIYTKAKSLAFTAFITLSGVSVVVLQLIGKESESVIVAYTLIFFMIIYWICYMIVNHNN